MADDGTIIKDIMRLTQELKDEGKEVVSLGVGVPFYGMPREMKEYVISLIQNDPSIDIYTQFPGMPALRDELAKVSSEVVGRTVAREEILVTAGSMAALYYALTSLVSDGDEVIVPSPFFDSYREQVELSGGKLVEVPLLFSPEGWRLDVSQIEKAVNSNTRAIILNSPNNPTGAVTREEDCRAIAKIAIEHQLYVITDEAYDFLTYDSAYFNIASISELWPRVVRCCSFSKKYGMTGWREGYLHTNVELMEKIARIHDNDVVCAPHIAQRATLYAMTHHIAELDENNRGMEKNRELICSRLGSLNEYFEYAKPEGAFYLMVKLKIDLSDKDFSYRLLKEAGVVTIPGSVFGHAGTGFVRLSYGGKYEDIDRAMDKMEEWLRRQ